MKSHPSKSVRDWAIHAVHCTQNGDMAGAIHCYEQALTLARRAGDRQSETAALGSMASLYADLGRMSEAIAANEQALALARQLGHQAMIGVILGNLGIACRQVGRMQDALARYEEALVIAAEAGDYAAQARQWSNRGLALHLLGDTAGAMDDFERAMAMAVQLGDRLLEGCAHTHLGAALLSAGQPVQAAQHDRQALEAHHALGLTSWQSYDLIGLACAWLEMGQVQPAIEAAATALSLNVAETAHDAALWLGIAHLYAASPSLFPSQAGGIIRGNKRENARAAFQTAIEKSRALLAQSPELYEPRYTLACALAAQAACALTLSSPPQAGGMALEELRKALSICALPGIVRDAQFVLTHLRRAMPTAVATIDSLLALLNTHSSAEQIG